MLNMFSVNDPILEKSIQVTIDASYLKHMKTKWMTDSPEKGLQDFLFILNWFVFNSIPKQTHPVS